MLQQVMGFPHLVHIITDQTRSEREIKKENKNGDNIFNQMKRILTPRDKLWGENVNRQMLCMLNTTLWWTMNKQLVSRIVALEKNRLNTMETKTIKSRCPGKAGKEKKPLKYKNRHNKIFRSH